MPQSAEEYLREIANADLQKVRETLVGLQDAARELATIDLDLVPDEHLPNFAGLAKKLVDSSSFLNISIIVLNAMGHQQEKADL